MNTNDTRARILALLNTPMSRTQIGEEIQRGESTLKYHINILRAEGKIHVSAWIRKIGTGGDHAAIYKAGAGVDKKKPGKERRGLAQARHYKKYAARYRLKRRAQWTIGNPFAALMQGAR